jgi:hypothetical protein
VQPDSGRDWLVVVVVLCAGSFVDGGKVFVSASTTALVVSCGGLLCCVFAIAETCSREIVGRVVNT